MSWRDHAYDDCPCGDPIPECKSCGNDEDPIDAESLCEPCAEAERVADEQRAARYLALATQVESGQRCSECLMMNEHGHGLGCSSATKGSR